jgi:AraC-like DNA-binding protein
MDKSNMNQSVIYREQRFRTPLNAERDIGLWVDRIGMDTSRHKHQQLRILGQYAAVYIEQGEGIFTSPSTGDLLLYPGQVILHFPGIPCVYYPKTEWKTRWIVWNGPDAARLEQLGYLRQNLLILSDTLQAVLQAHERLSMLMTQEDLSSVLERKTIILEMIRRLFLMSQRNQTNRGLQNQMAEIVEFIRRSYNKKISIDTLAKRFACSETHFRRIFHTYTGRSPRQFITSLRISQAKELLTQGKSIKQTSRLVGYQDVFYFLRVFKKTTGFSPRRFMNSSS